MKISFFFLFFIGQSVMALDQCPNTPSYKPVDLRSEMGPMRSQGAMGWCYGFTAAELMTHYLYKKGTIKKINSSTMVSALGVSTSTNYNFDPTYAPYKQVLEAKFSSELIKRLDREALLRAQEEFINKTEPKGTFRQFLSNLNPFSEKPPLAPAKKPVLENIPLPPRISTAKDLVPWDKVDFKKTTKQDKFTIEARSQIRKEFSKTGNFFEARENYLKTIKNLHTDDLSAMGVSDIVKSGGDIYAAIKAADTAYCTEDEARSGDVGMERFDLRKMLNSLYDLTGKHERVTCNNLLSLKRMLPTTSLQDIFKVLKNEDRAHAYEVLIENTCKKKLNGSNPPAVLGWYIPIGFISNEKKETFAQLEMLKRMDQVLASGTPAGISYYSGFLSQNTNMKTAPHASTVVGKRFNPEKCEDEYIIKNSYGTGCSYYKKLNPEYVQCINESNQMVNEKLKNKKKSRCDKMNLPTYYNPAVRCEDGTGYLFVTKSELAKNIFGLTYIKE